MNAGFAGRVKTLLEGDPSQLAGWLASGRLGRLAFYLALIAIGFGAYGATIGLWRSGEQALFVAAKLPMVVALTCAGNAALNGILAQVYGSGLSFLQTSLAILMSFAVASLVLLALSPIALFLLWNTPPLASADATVGHSITMLAHVGAIAVAGIVGTRSLYRALQRLAPSAASARSTLLAWLSGNLLLGSQVSWILRPFIGNPLLPVEFLRDDPLYGNFFEQVWQSVERLFF